MFQYINHSNSLSLTKTCNNEISKALTNANRMMQSSHMIGVTLVAFSVFLFIPYQFKGNGESWISIKGALVLIWIGSTIIGSSRIPFRAEDDEETVHTFLVITVGCRFILYLLSNAASLYIGLKIIDTGETSSDILASCIIVHSILDFFVNMTNLGMWMLYVQLCEQHH